ncbi:hypothetical protein K443DRAFT_392023 [Laccaria amethystina LaAM-08-1]|uniref:Uncharacterized protein n=1 Tax=Laccaria amethystina LaAM-08-1 TaxID=1095629 RepID=A0A0C9YGZ3_9AGAR|nr:hypothetical protein K443DRAFT_392023 [Laccaria amethystina LaAM-08-1]
MPIYAQVQPPLLTTLSPQSEMVIMFRRGGYPTKYAETRFHEKEAPFLRVLCHYQYVLYLRCRLSALRSTTSSSHVPLQAMV